MNKENLKIIEEFLIKRILSKIILKNKMLKSVPYNKNLI